MDKIKKKNLNLTQIYLGTFLFFIVSFLGIFISPLVTGETYKYTEAELNEYQSFGNNLSIALIKKEYNPKNELMRLVFSVEKETDSSSLSNIEYELNSRFIKGKTEQEVEVIPVSEDYIVVLIKDVPEGFSVLSTTITPKYIHPELEGSNDLEDRNIKIYVNESEKLINNDLNKVTLKEYKKEHISFQQNKLKEQITYQEKEIKTKKLAISEVKKTLEYAEEEMKYQTEEEKFETQIDINSHQTTLNQYEKDIESLNNVISDLNEKIILLDEKSKSL